jgi:SAM-dependent methyltransferase
MPDSGVPPQFERNWKERFEKFAGLRDDDAGIAGWSPTGLEARVRRFRGLWHPADQAGRWLDAGCGAGTYSRILAEGGKSVVAVDYSLPSLRKAAVRSICDISLAVADVRRLPFRDAEFEGVLCFGVTQALAESGDLVQELARQLKPGGELWIDGLNAWCLVHVLEKLNRCISGEADHLRYESAVYLRRILETCGLVEIRLYWMPVAPSRYRRLQALFETAFVDRIFRNVPGIACVLSHAFILAARKPPV